MASADFSAPVFHHRWRLWPFRAGVEISGNKVQVFPPAGRGFTTLLRLGFGLRLSLQTCPQVGLISAFCSCPPRFASGFLRPRPHGRKFAISSLVPPNWPIGDFHSSPVSCPTYKRTPPLCRTGSLASLSPSLTSARCGRPRMWRRCSSIWRPSRPRWGRRGRSPRAAAERREPSP